MSVLWAPLTLQNVITQFHHIAVTAEMDTQETEKFVKHTFSLGYFTYSRDLLDFSPLDVDECLTGQHDCDVNAECTNTDGNLNCSCLVGYLGNAER